MSIRSIYAIDTKKMKGQRSIEITIRSRRTCYAALQKTLKSHFLVSS